jgi:hypothetical protein
MRSLAPDPNTTPAMPNVETNDASRAVKSRRVNEMNVMKLCSFPDVTEEHKPNDFHCSISTSLAAYLCDK